MTDVKTNSKWIAEKEFSIGIGSHSQNPNTTSLRIPKGTALIWDGDSPNGNVWFKLNLGGVDYRGKIESGSILNVLKADKISLLDNGNGFTVYSEKYVKNYLV
jgi:hypothetical protein